MHSQIYCGNLSGSYNLDISTVLDRVGGDEELLREISAMFLEDYPNLIGEIRSAIDAGDHRRLEVAAHTLKGSVANFGAQEAVDAAYRLELIGRTRQLMEAPQALRVLEAQFSMLQPALEKLSRE